VIAGQREMLYVMSRFDKKGEFSPFIFFEHGVLLW